MKYLIAGALIATLYIPCESNYNIVIGNGNRVHGDGNNLNGD